MPRVSHVEIPVEVRGRDPVIRLTERLFLPLARIWLRYGLTAYEISEVLRWAMAQVALHDQSFAIAGRQVHKQTVSHAAVRTGIPRSTVDQLAGQLRPQLDAITAKYHRAARIHAGWRRDRDFLDKAGQPLELPVRGRGDQPSFEKLVMRYGRDVPARALADELVQTGNAERTAGRRMRLLTEVYIGASQIPDDCEVLAKIAEDFMEALSRALDPELKDESRTGAVCYEHLPPENDGEIREPAIAYIGRQMTAERRVDERVMPERNPVWPAYESIGALAVSV